MGGDEHCWDRRLIIPVRNNAVNANGSFPSHGLVGDLPELSQSPRERRVGFESQVSFEEKLN